VSERACGADERRGVERGRRVVGAGPPAHVVDDRLVGRVERLREDLRDVAVPDALGLVALVVQVEVARLEGVAAGLGQVPVQLPVRFGIERFDLSLAVDDQLERRSLHPAHGDEVLAELAGGQREEAGERRAPRQVDHLPGLPAAARSKSSSSGFANASFTSLSVIEENRTRSMGASSFTSRTSSYASLPISSPSRS